MALATNGPDFQGDDVSLETSSQEIYEASGRATAGEPEVIIVQNLHPTAVVTVGGSDVADGSNGVVLAAQYDTLSIPLRSPKAKVYAISDTASTPITVTRA